MSMPRYFALLAADRDARDAWQLDHTGGPYDTDEFPARLIGDRAVVIAAADAAMDLAGQGLLIGDVYRRGDRNCQHTFDVGEAGKIIASDGEWLTRAYWGSYVALIAPRHRNDVSVVRAPFGELGCFLTHSPHGVVVASDIELLTRFAGFRPQVDRSSLIGHIAGGELYGRRTALKDLDELLGGERLTVHADRQSITSPWRIWDFVHPGRRLEEEDAAGRVRDAVRTAIIARASRFDRTVLRLSGGLDSSIVAACLAGAHVPFSAVTMVTRDRAGDERAFARSVSNHFGLALAEIRRDPRNVDVTASAARGLPRPSARSFAQASVRAADDIARETGASAILDGGGGDHIFASLQSVAPVADCLVTGGGTGRFWGTARSIGIAASTSTLNVARRALFRRWTRGPAYRWPIDVSLLSQDARIIAGGAVDHPWLHPAKDVLPGSAAHVALLAGAHSILQGRDPHRAIPEVSPLLAQPVAETCLRVPSWMWTRDGHDRVVARDAFRTALPRQIIERRDKGAPDSFQIELIETNRDMIRAMLTEGYLVRHDIVDPAAIEAQLEPARLAKGLGYIRLMQLVDAEAWARSWR